MSTYPREELDEMVKRWLEANERAEADNDWRTHLGPFYTDDCLYTWNLGPNDELEVHGRAAIEAGPIGEEMLGFDGWTFPYTKTLIDHVEGEVVGFWRMIAPFRRADGSSYELAGTGGSWFRYAGNYQWSWQRDFFDLGNTFALFAELAGDGHLVPELKARVHRQARGGAEGQKKIREGVSLGDKLRAGAAMAKVLTLGK